MAGWNDERREPKDTPPSIDISSYGMPVAADKNLVGVAVLYLTKGEGEAVKEFARQVKSRRGAKGVQSVTIAWGTRVTSTNEVPAQERAFVSVTSPTTVVGASVDSGVRGTFGDAPPGWSKFRNTAVGRIEYVAPDNKRYIQDELGKFIEVPATCNRGHDLPSGQSWCKVCGQGGWPTEKVEPPKTDKPGPVKPLNRFAGLDL